MYVRSVLFHLTFTVFISFLFKKLTSVFRTPFHLLCRAFVVSLTLVNMLLLNRLVVDPVARYMTFVSYVCKTYNKVILILDFSCFILLN